MSISLRAVPPTFNDGEFSKDGEFTSSIVNVLPVITGVYIYIPKSLGFIRDTLKRFLFRKKIKKFRKKDFAYSS